MYPPRPWVSAPPPGYPFSPHATYSPPVIPRIGRKPGYEPNNQVPLLSVTVKVACDFSNNFISAWDCIQETSCFLAQLIIIKPCLWVNVIKWAFYFVGKISDLTNICTQAFCSRLGAKLAEIETVEENNFLRLHAFDIHAGSKLYFFFFYFWGWGGGGQTFDLCDWFYDFREKGFLILYAQWVV